MIVNSNRFNFENFMTPILKQYSLTMSDVVEDCVVDVAKESVKKLKATSPKGPGGYAKNWTYEKEKGRVHLWATVYGKTPTYRLAHLLEYGHPIKRGGRTVGHADAIPHIGEVHDWAVEEAFNEVVSRLERLSR